MNYKIKYQIILEQDEDNVFIISCPQFQGCHTYGRTIEEAIENVQEVIEIYKEELIELK